MCPWPRLVIIIHDTRMGRDAALPFDYSSLPNDPGVTMSWSKDRWCIDILRSWNSVNSTSEKQGSEDWCKSQLHGV